MYKRCLGRTNLMVSCIGLGGMGFISKSYKGDRPYEIINTALDEGINFIDTARSYYNSEIVIGNAIKGRRKDCYLASKTYLRHANEVKKEIGLSLKNLQVDNIDIYQIHHVQYEEELKRVLAKDGALNALKEARKNSKINYIGVSTHNPKIALRCIRTGEFDTIQVPFSPVEREFIGEILEEAKRYDVGIIAMKPLAGGRITNVELALKFILSHDISIVIVGCSTVKEIRLDAYVAKNSIFLSDCEKTILFESVDKLGDNFCRRCRYCEHVCPAEIPISDIFRCEDHILYNVTYARNEYRKFQFHKKNQMCTECGKCEQICPYNLPVITMLKNADRRLIRGRAEDILVGILRKLNLYEKLRNMYFKLGFRMPER